MCVTIMKNVVNHVSKKAVTPPGNNMRFVEVDGHGKDIASPEDVAKGDYELQVY